MAGKSRHNQDEVIVETLARGECQTTAAQRAGCSVTTIRRRLDDPQFRERIERFRVEMLDAVAGKMGANVEQAVTTLTALMADAMPPAVRLGAARAVCDFALRIRESLSWTRRLTALEERLHDNESTNTD